MRLCKFFALRKIIRRSNKTKSKLEQERLKRRDKEKSNQAKSRLYKRKKALEVLNDENVSREYLVKGKSQLKKDEKKEFDAESDKIETKNIDVDAEYDEEREYAIS